MSVIGLHYFNALSLPEIAQRLQISTQRAAQINCQALSDLRRDPVLSAVYAPDYRPIERPQRCSLRRYQQTHTSSTEAAAIQRISRKHRAAREVYARHRRWIEQGIADGLFTQEQANAFLEQKRQALGL